MNAQELQELTDTCGVCGRVNCENTEAQCEANWIETHTCEHCKEIGELNAINLCEDCSHNCCGACGEIYEITANEWANRVYNSTFVELQHTNCTLEADYLADSACEICNNYTKENHATTDFWNWVCVDCWNKEKELI